MTFFKLMATTTIVGLTCTAALSNEINFSQDGGGSVASVAFTQTGGGNSIGTSASASTVTGSLDVLSIEQKGGDNAASFDITTATDVPSTGSVQILATGSRNTSDLTVNQSGAEMLAFAVAIEGNDNSVTANIDGVSSVVNMESRGDNIAYDISQTGADADTSYDHTIIANVSKTGSGDATINLDQSGANNTIELGKPSTFGTFDAGTVGLTLQGAATVTINQSATNATYNTTQTVPAGGSLTVVQSN